METSSPAVRALRRRFHRRIVTWLIALAVVGCIAQAVQRSGDPRPAPPITARTPSVKVDPAQGSN
jgi:hypothetical protein